MSKNISVSHLKSFKKEFDFFRQKKTPHPEILNLKRNLIPAQFSEIINWKNLYNSYFEKINEKFY
mgnify:CR=1 FL=1